MYIVSSWEKEKKKKKRSKSIPVVHSSSPVHRLLTAQKVDSSKRLSLQNAERTKEIEVVSLPVKLQLGNKVNLTFVQGGSNSGSSRPYQKKNGTSGNHTYNFLFTIIYVRGGSRGLMRLQEACLGFYFNKNRQKKNNDLVCLLLKIIILCKRHVYIVIGPNTKLLLAILLVIPLQNVVTIGTKLQLPEGSVN